MYLGFCDENFHLVLYKANKITGKIRVGLATSLFSFFHPIYVRNNRCFTSFSIFNNDFHFYDKFNRLTHTLTVQGSLTRIDCHNLTSLGPNQELSQRWGYLSTRDPIITRE